MSKKSDFLRWNLLLIKKNLKVVEMTTKDLESFKFRINLVEKAGGGLERITSNLERSSTMGKTLSKSVAAKRILL